MLSSFIHVVCSMYHKLRLNYKKGRKVTDPLHLAGHLLSPNFTWWSRRERTAMTNLCFGDLSSSRGNGKRGLKEMKSTYPMWAVLPSGIPGQMGFQKSGQILVCCYMYLKSIVLANFWFRENCLFVLFSNSHGEVKDKTMAMHKSRL